MSKHSFKNSEKFAVWKTHAEKCFWCDEPLALQETTVDHILPESLLNNPEKFQRTIIKYGLNDSFKINDFENWVPCHHSCNSKKGAQIYKASQVLLSILERVGRKADQARKTKIRIENNKRIGEALTKVQVLYDEKKISREDLIAIFSNSDEQESKLLDDLEKVILDIDPKWKVVSIDNNLAIVSDGRLAGRTPVSQYKHESWRCPECGSFGPWSGSRCLNCGRSSDGWN